MDASGSQTKSLKEHQRDVSDFLDHLTTETGGKSYDIHEMKVSQAFAEIAGELRSLYGVATPEPVCSAQTWCLLEQFGFEDENLSYSCPQ